MNSYTDDGRVVQIESGNFILRRAPPFENGQRVKVNVESRKPEPPPKPTRKDLVTVRSNETPDQRHKTVVYFGDTNRRDCRPDFLTELKKVQKSSSASGLDRDEVDEVDEVDAIDRENHFARIQVKAGATSDSPNEIVLNLSPSRADVLRIEEDESSLDDYWSLPGDTTGFKADWSFVQQWRLRG